jgi:hypothetical protein
MKKLRVFRVRPESYDHVIQAVGATKKLSTSLRDLIEQACTKPPEAFPVREKKAELCAISLCMDETSHSALVNAARAANVSKNLFLEAVFLQAHNSHNSQALA